MLSKLRKNQNGTALISALFVTALVAILATAIAFRERVLIDNAELISQYSRSYQALQYVRNQAIARLQRYAKTPSIRLKTQIPAQRILQTTVSAQLIDQQGKYNIDNLKNTANIPQFARLLSMLDPRLDHHQTIQQAQFISQWMQKKSSNHYYLKQSPPYRAAHQAMVMLSTLRAVRGVSAALYLRLRPYLTAIPLSKYPLKININTASAPVLATTSAQLSLAKAKAVVQCRREYGNLDRLSAFERLCVKPLGVKPLKNITLTSHYFLLKASASQGQQHYMLTSLLQIQRPKKKYQTAPIRLVWQTMS